MTPPPVQAVWLNAPINSAEPQPEPVETQADRPPPPSAADPPPLAPALLPSPPAPLIAVATPVVAFAVTTKNSATVVPPASAVPVAASPAQRPDKPQAPAVQRLTYGQGEGDQPAPDYPREAAAAQQQGTVVVRLTVDETGKVTSAVASKSCPFPLLNQAAVRQVKEGWRFKPGPQRVYEVSIQFQLQ